MIGRPRKKSSKRFGTSIKVYLDKSTTDTLADFTIKTGLAYVSNAARFIIITFLKQQSELVNLSNAERQNGQSSLKIIPNRDGLNGFQDR